METSTRQAPAGGFELDYEPSLDGVRAVAVLGVFAFHAYARPPFRGGFLGVDVFFVLSGFLITGILLKERGRKGTVSFARFYARRALRLLPALVLVSVAVLVYLVAVRPAQLGANLRELAAALGYSDNWYQALAKPPEDTLMSHAWSLSIEEQFYVLWPVALVLALRRGLGLALGLALAGAVASAAVRAVEWQTVSPRYVYGALENRTGALLVGCAVALAAVRGDLARPTLRRLGRVALAPSVVVVAAFMALSRPSSSLLNEGGATLFALAVAVVLANLVVWRAERLRGLLAWTPLVLIGEISYGVYLWHAPILRVLHGHVANDGEALLIALPITLAVAVLSHRLVERPFLRLKRRYGGGERAEERGAAPSLAASV